MSNWTQNTEVIFDEISNEPIAIIVDGMRLTIEEYHQQYPLEARSSMEILDMKNENPLWRNYMDNVKEDKWMKEIELQYSFDIEIQKEIISAKHHATYTQNEFEEMLINNKEFNEKWGKL